MRVSRRLRISGGLHAVAVFGVPLHLDWRRGSHSDTDHRRMRQPARDQPKDHEKNDAESLSVGAFHTGSVTRRGSRTHAASSSPA